MEQGGPLEIGTGSSGSRVIAVALDGGSKSKHIVKRAVEKFAPEEKVVFKLLHIYPMVTHFPMPMGNLIPLTQIKEDVAVAYKKEIELQRNEMILPYQQMVSQKGVPVEIVMVQAANVANAISSEIARHGIKELVIGASTNSLFARRIEGQLLSSVISDCAPAFCTVYVVSKGKIEALRRSV